MALMLNEKPGLINGSNDVEAPEMDTALLMSLLEDSQCDDRCNEEQVSSWMECLEAEIRMGSAGPCSVEGEDIERFEWSEMEMASSSPIDDMNWYVEDDVEEMSMDGYFVQLGNDFAFNCYEDGFTSL
ncbi:hypothetical protein HRI_000145800 [Hibiscus trionum]|uniref:Uncharacterized protein n=1 Tax=Hibiscus trionum TaxID=183268 RepID=A0A9W7GVM5_HIBTR|nr:hypothetical protein HRI_000145800 [Hibiscus trionum]